MTVRTRSFTLRLPAELAADLDIVAAVERLPAAVLIREAIAGHIRDRVSDPDFQAELRARISTEAALLTPNVSRGTLNAEALISPITPSSNVAHGYGSDPSVPPMIHPIGECDWGSCEEPSVGWRYSEKLPTGWLPVCRTHLTR